MNPLRNLISTLLCLSLVSFTPNSARAQQDQSAYREALHKINAFGSGLSTPQKVGALMFIGGAVSAGFHAYILGYNTATKQFLVHLIYKQSAFPLAMMVASASILIAVIGALVYVISPSPASARGTYVDYLKGEGLSAFLDSPEEKQLELLHAYPAFGNYILDLSQRLTGVEILPNRI